MNNPYLFHPAMAPFTPRPCPPVPPPPARHPGLYEDMDGYTRKEIDDADARTLASAKGYADGTKVGKADLFDNPDSAPKIKSELLPSYVDDVLEYASLSDFPATGESGKIYIAKDTNKTYRWIGTQYVQVGGGGDVPITVVKRNGTALTPVGGAVDIEVPTGTAASKDVPASGDADENQVVLGNDSRLTDSRVPTQHYHSMDDISDLAFPNHKVWAATATGSGTLYTLTPFGNDFSLEEGCVIIYKCPADMGNAGVVYIKVGSAQHLLHWAKSGTQPTFSSVKSGDICIIQFRSDYGGWWALHGVNAYTAYQKPSSGIPSTDLASAVQTALTNARTPTAHASTHRSDGADPLDGSMIEVGGTGTYATAGIDTAIESIDTEIGNINTSLSGKVDSSDLATVATTGDYDDLLNKPTIPSAQVNADWNAASGVAQILNKPTIPDVSGKADAASLAPAFSASSTYAVGAYVTHEGLLYKCTTAVSTAGAWNAANWSAESVFKNLPYDKEVAYIVVGEGAYIDTQIVPDNTFLWSHTFRIDSEWSGSYWEMGTNSPFCGFIRGNIGKTNLWVYAYGNYSSVQTSSFSDFETMHTESGGKLYVGSTLVATQTLSTATSSQTYWIGARTGSVPRLRFSATKLWKGGVLVRDFIPVVKDGAGGFYDRVSGLFFGGSGTGTIGFPADTLPLMDGTAAHGSSPETAPIDHVHPTDTSRAPLASPAFTGTPTAPTAAAGTNTTQVATTAFVQSAIAALRSELGLT